MSTPAEISSVAKLAELVAFVDSSALVALADAGDASHDAVVAAYHELRLAGYRFFTTNLMLVESYDMLFAGPGPAIAAAWLTQCQIALHTVDEKDLTAAKSLLARVGVDGGLSLTDAISGAVIGRYGVQDVFAVDQGVLHALE